MSIVVGVGIHEQRVSQGDQAGEAPAPAPAEAPTADAEPAPAPEKPAESSSR